MEANRETKTCKHCNEKLWNCTVLMLVGKCGAGGWIDKDASHYCTTGKRAFNRHEPA